VSTLEADLIRDLIYLMRSTPVGPSSFVELPSTWTREPPADDAPRASEEAAPPAAGGAARPRDDEEAREHVPEKKEN